ncbi:MAG: hypothetical protein IJJ70_07255 [Treponema sp.]|nr:hypothetical protein [Treponema sp.]MBR0487481.1 hypothetical protein [Treponema sp.]
MINVKSVSISAATGFILSFLVGIICRNAFLSVLLRAFISALVFSAVAAGSSFLYSKFLSQDGTPSEPSSRPQSRTSGQVDLVIDDDPLEEEENGPKFFVENNRSALQSDAKPSAAEKVDPDEDVTEEIAEEAAGASDVAPLQPVADQVAPVNPVPAPEPEITAPPKAMDAVPKNDAAFTPVNLAASAPQVSASPEGAPADEQLPEVDSLPDIEDLDTGKKDGEIGDIINDSEFATSGKSSGGAQFPDGQTASTQNADVMAQAIRTILSKDN